MCYSFQQSAKIVRKPQTCSIRMRRKRQPLSQSCTPKRMNSRNCVDVLSSIDENRDMDGGNFDRTRFYHQRSLSSFQVKTITDLYLFDFFSDMVRRDKEKVHNVNVDNHTTKLANENHLTTSDVTASDDGFRINPKDEHEKTKYHHFRLAKYRHFHIDWRQIIPKARRRKTNAQVPLAKLILVDRLDSTTCCNLPHISHVSMFGRIGNSMKERHRKLRSRMGYVQLLTNC